MINQEEYEILKDLDDRLGWLARDRDGDLVAYENKPEKSTSFWFDDGRMVNLGLIFDDGRLFQFIQWEDEEPYRISDLIKGYENKEHTFRLGNFEVSDFVDNSSGKSYTVFSLVVGEDEEMKKDKEWLKEKIEEELKGWEAIDSRVGESVIEDVLYCVDQLDEPEVLSEEWIENKKWQAYDPDARTLYWAVTETDLENLLVPKQELPVIPKFVAELLRKNKKDNFKLIDTYGIALERGSWVDRKLVDWLQEDWTREDIFARAWLDGFTVEEEQKLTARDVIEKHIELLKKQEEAVNLKPYYDLLERIKNE